MTDLLRRRWVVAPIPEPATTVPPDVLVRTTTPADDPALATLLDQAYRDTIDFDREHSHVDELKEWREVDGADDDASFVAVRDGQIVAASLIGSDVGADFVYEVASAPDVRRTGLASCVLAASMSVLSARPSEALWAWITDGNHASEALFRRAGFVTVTPPVDQRAAGLRYRALFAAKQLDLTSALAAAAVLPAPEGAHVALVVVSEAVGEETTVEVHGARVATRWMLPSDPAVAQVAADGMPVHGVAWLLRARNKSAESA